MLTPSPLSRSEPSTGGAYNWTELDRLAAFEKMLADIQAQAAFEQSEMDRLKAEGKVKTVTYRQYFSNRMLYKMMLDKYAQYGLLER